MINITDFILHIKLKREEGFIKKLLHKNARIISSRGCSKIKFIKYNSYQMIYRMENYGKYYIYFP